MRATSFVFSLAILSGFPFYSSAESVKPLSVEVEYSDLKIEGTVDRESVRRALSAKRKDFAACGFAEGKLDLSFKVSEDGEITDSKSVLTSKRDPKTEDCFKGVLSQVNFKFSGIQNSANMSLQFEIGRKQREAAQEQQQQAKEVELAKTEANKPKPQETKADKENREYLERVKANALKENQIRKAKQDALLKVQLACTEQYRKDNLLERYDNCMASAKYGGAKSAATIPDSIKSCHKTCESQRVDLEMKCQNCSGGPVARNNCVSSCQRNIASQIDRCAAGCR